MKGHKIIREYLLYKEKTPKELAEEMGYKYASNVTNILNRGGMRLDSFIKMIEQLGGEIKVIDQETGREWELD